MGSIEEHFMDALSYQEDALSAFLNKHPDVTQVLSSGGSEDIDRALSRELFAKLDKDMLGELGESYQDVMMKCEFDDNENKFKAYDSNGSITENCKGALERLRNAASRFASDVRSLL